MKQLKLEYRDLTPKEIAELVPYALHIWDETRCWDAVVNQIKEIGLDLFGFNIDPFFNDTSGVQHFRSAWWDRYELFWSKEYGQ
jgi:hypothetical protein|tara:strand:+ start:950 stop:1201 length:252 start_codon:yes stop_codon:yes gene_type:complete